MDRQQGDEAGRGKKKKNISGLYPVTPKAWASRDVFCKVYHGHAIQALQSKYLHSSSADMINFAPRQDVTCVGSN